MIRHRSVRPSQWLVLVAAAILALGVFVGLPVATSQSAAAATVGDVVFAKSIPCGGCGEWDIVRKNTTGSEVTLVSGADSEWPDVSKDGSRIAYMSVPYTGGYKSVWVANSDGSGATQLTHPDSTSPDASLHFDDAFPRWSPDGTKIAFDRNGYASPNTHHIFVMNSDGTGLTDLTPSDPLSNQDQSVSWSPDGSKLAYTRLAAGLNQVWVMNSSSGSGAHLIDPGTSCNNWQPDWSPDGTRVYVGRDCVGTLTLAYLTSTDSFATAGNSTLHTLVTGLSDTGIRVSGDGATVYYDDLSKLWSANTSTGATTLVADDTGTSNSDRQPAPVKATYPVAPPSNSTLTFSAPSPSDAPYTRQVTVGLSTTGIQRFELGWSTSSTTAPNTSYVQTITNMTTKKGPINFLGKYSGTGTTWNGGTQPDQDWYLWVRSVKTNGTANAWATPHLLVHTPKTPTWVAVGDSYSSGHHEASDQPQCPTELDGLVGHIFENQAASCIGGGSHLPSNDPTPNDASSAWVSTALTSYNSSTHAPTVWQPTLGFLALSGAATSEFGNGSFTPGTSSWATRGQSGQMSVSLYTRYDSWNVVSMTGGADDTNWTGQLANWYLSHWNTPSTKPWSVTTGISDCPDANEVYNYLTVSGFVIPGVTIDSLIQANLQGMVTVAANASPGVRVLNVGYPYTTDSTGNSCYADSGSTKGVHSVIADLNSDHTFVSGANVKYVDLTASTAFGNSPVTNGYISLNRLYGYPHPTVGAGSTTGQSKIASAAITVLTGAGW